MTPIIFSRYNNLMKKLMPIPFKYITGQVFAVEVAPRISDREIIESLAELKAGQSALQQQIDDLKESANKRFDDTNRRIDDLKESNNKQFDTVNKRLDTLQWLLGLFTTVALSVMVIMGKVLWNQQKKLVPLCI